MAIEKPNIYVKNIRDQDTEPVIPQEQLKLAFDKTGADIVAYLDTLIDALLAPEATQQLGAMPLYHLDPSNPNISAKLLQLKAMIDTTNKTIGDLVLDPRVIPYGSITADKLAPNIAFDMGTWGDDGQRNDDYNPYDFATVGYGLDVFRRKERENEP